MTGLEKEYLEKLASAVYSQDAGEAERLCKEYLKQSFNAYKGIVEGLAQGIRKVGEDYECGNMWLPDMMAASQAMKAGLKVLMPHVGVSGESSGRTKVILGTIEGDIHDVGKNLVGVILAASGYDVEDLGVDVPAPTFIDKALEARATIVGISALLTTTMTKMGEVIRYAVERGCRDKFKIIIGGAPTSKEFADRIGADGYAPDAISVPRVLRELLAGQ